MSDQLISKGNIPNKELTWFENTRALGIFTSTKITITLLGQLHEILLELEEKDPSPGKKASIL